ncbi:carboxypeptidase regulatory-like domain-containing protein [Streptomyces sp. NPDC017254]|uniref:carboxypeptidase regulatory-like domain-containing protein n=1 Tax=unclassified Streptomyces TaxID=2593676 RepID=UPI0037B30430
MAAKGCGTSSCSQADLLASGQWMVAPTDASGANPRPDLAPDVINNSWGADIIDTWYKDTVQSWRDAGIFPSFSNGNAGTEGCNTAGPPALRGDVAATERILDETAIDTQDTSCGGTADFNNVWGEGRLDAYAAVNATPRGALGAIGGKVGSGDTGVAGATVTPDGPMKSTLTTGSDGCYSLPKVLVGDYKVTVSKFGYHPTGSTVTIVENGTSTRDFTLEKAPDATLGGTVRTEGGVEAGATVVVQGTPVKTVSAADGTYSVPLPVGAYNIAVTPVSRCATATTVRVELTASAGRDFDLGSREDGFGTTCQVGTGAFPTGDTKLAIASPTAGSAPIDLPFPVALYGRTYRSATATVKGVLAFGATSVTSANISLPSTSVPNGALYPFWDNLQIDTGSSTSGVYWATRGTTPHRTTVVEWRDLQFISAPAQRISFSVVIGEDGTVSYHYKDIDSGTYENGSGATIVVEDHNGTDALQYSFNQAAVATGMSVSFRTGRSAVLAGTVTDDNDGKPVAGATVKVAKDGTDMATGTTGADGSYLLQVPAGSTESAYGIAVSAEHYSGATAVREVRARGIAVADAVLKTALVKSSADQYTVVVPAEQERTRTLTLSNAGTATAYTVKEKGDASWITITATSGVLAKGAEQKVGLVFDTEGATPGTVLDGTLLITSESGRDPVIEIPLKIVVPAYQAALDTGATGSITDLRGDSWGPDQAYKAGSYGYIGSGSTTSTKKTISGTDEQGLYRTARTGAQEYRFDNVPNGVYRIELGFAEVSGTRPGARVVDLLAEGREFVPNLDIALEAGTFTALDKTITVEVTDGQLNVRLSAIHGKSLVNSLRVTQRPDLAS